MPPIVNQLSLFRYHYLVFSFMQDEETELELPFTEEELQASPLSSNFFVEYWLLIEPSWVGIINPFLDLEALPTYCIFFSEMTFFILRGFPFYL